MMRLLLCFALFLCCHQGPFAQNKRPNVLFIFVDDLRPDLGCYGNTEVKSPFLDAFARQGVVFQNQYVAVPTCGASRASILTGMYPKKVVELTNEAAAKTISGKPAGDRPETFIEHFKRNGYTTIGIGKVSHSADGFVYGYNQSKSNKPELPNSWNEMLFDAGKWGTGWNAFFGYADGSSRMTRQGNVKPYEAGDCEDEGYPDGRSAALAIEKLGTLAHSSQPFFMGLGFFKPHLPFNAPQKYWDLYNEKELPLAPYNAIPRNASMADLHPSAELKTYKQSDELPSLAGPVSNEYARKLRHAYYACISYVDAQIGRVLLALKETGLEKNTIVVIWGDHGWHLGDDLTWGKHTLFEWSLRSVFMLRTPQTEQAKQVNKIVSAVDIYPTLTDLCGLQMPYNSDGKSLLPLIKNSGASGWRDAALSYFNKGISIRTPRYRFTQYFRKEMPAVELYDHKADPYEQENIAAKKPEVVKSMQEKWKDEIVAAQKIYNPEEKGL